MSIDIGISEGDRNQIAGELSKVLADTYTVYMKTHAFHWNVTGPMFRSLHEMFEEQYTELWKATDVIAERIRAIGAMAPGSFSQFTQLSSISEESGVPSAQDMIKQLVEGHEAASKTAQRALKVAEDADDEVTVDMLVERMDAHQEAAWMLRSMLAD